MAPVTTSVAPVTSRNKTLNGLSKLKFEEPFKPTKKRLIQLGLTRDVLSAWKSFQQPGALREGSVPFCGVLDSVAFRM